MSTPSSEIGSRTARPGRHPRLLRRGCRPRPARAGALGVQPELARRGVAVRDRRGAASRGSPSPRSAARPRRRAGRSATTTSSCSTPSARCPAKELTALADRIWYPIWDAGVRLDHSVRTVTQCRPGRGRRPHRGRRPARPRARSPATPTLVAAARSTVAHDWRGNARKRLPQLVEAVACAPPAPGRPGAVHRARAQGGPRRPARHDRARRPRRGVARRPAARRGRHGLRAPARRARRRPRRHRSGPRPAGPRRPRRRRGPARPRRRRRPADRPCRAPAASSPTPSTARCGAPASPSAPAPCASAPAARRWCPSATACIASDGEVVLGSARLAESDEGMPLRAGVVAARAGLPIAPATLDNLARHVARPERAVAPGGP